MSVESPRLFLFDIDGTLILGGGAGETALHTAMQVRFGRTDGFTTITMAGSTDRHIAKELLVANDLPVTEENIAAVLETYLDVLPGLLSQRNGCLLPGIIPLLDRLSAHEGCVLGLLTGNLRRGAEIKLSHFGVWHYFPFGAFADDHDDRNELGAFACARALEYHGQEFPPERIYILGDTPKDIACGKVFGAKTVAIATGQYTKEELAKHDPDILFEDFTDLDAVMKSLFR